MRHHRSHQCFHLPDDLYFTSCDFLSPRVEPFFRRAGHRDQTIAQLAIIEITGGSIGAILVDAYREEHALICLVFLR